MLSVEKLCALQGFRNAFVRGALGSLVDACLARADGSCLLLRGPAIEVVSLAGEVRCQDDGSLRACLSGVVADTTGQVHGGPFVAGANPVCITFELTLEEWLQNPFCLDPGSRSLSMNQRDSHPSPHASPWSPEGRAA